MERQPGTSVRALRILIPFAVVLALTLVACSGGGSDDDAEESAVTSSEPMPASASGGSGEETAYAVTEARAPDQPGSDPAAGQIALDRLVIRTANLTLTVEDTVNAAAAVRNLAVAKGGFIFSSTTYTEDERQYAEVTLRVPSDRFDETIAELSSAPYVIDMPREQTSSQDVSAEYVDNESRLTALE